MSSLTVKHTYGSRNRQFLKSPQPPSSPLSTLSSSPPATPAIVRPSKRLFSDLATSPADENLPSTFPSLKRPKTFSKPTTVARKPGQKAISKTQKTLTQLHFNIDQTILRNCSLCDLSYTKGAPDDEALHRVHCSRVRQGMEWGREEEKDRVRNGKTAVIEVRTDIKLRNNKKGRIISFSADIGGKLGTKLATLLQTINLSLSAPDLTPSVLRSSKAYLLLIPHENQLHRECIVGCVLAQRITTAMVIVPSSVATSDAPPLTTPVVVDTTTNLCCSPTPLPTPMGISRLFVPLSHRRLGIARALLDAAAATFIYGCPLDTRKGQVAFSQPTGMGQAVMNSWGCTRVYEE